MSTETIIQLVAILLGSNWLGTFLTDLYKSKKKKKTPTEVILKALARHHLLQCADRYLAQGYINDDEYDDIFEEFNAYKALDGNGRVRRHYDKGGDVFNLPVR